MTTLRSCSVLVALCVTGTVYAQNPPVMAPDTPSPSVLIPTPNPELAGASSAQRQSALRLVAASPGNIDSGMRVKSPTGDVLGTVASIIPASSHNEGYVVIAGPEGTATPVPYGTASSMVRHDAIVLDKARFVNAPKVQQYQTEDGSSTVWEQKADSYWKRNANSADRTSGVRR